MASANIDTAVVANSYKLCLSLMERMKETGNMLSSRYQMAGRDWRDEKYRHLGEIVDECSTAISNALRTIEGCMGSLGKIVGALQEYEAVSFGGGGQMAGANSGGTPPLGRSFIGSSRPVITPGQGAPVLNEARSGPWNPSLSQTRQSSISGTYGGRQVNIFDHPMQSCTTAVINQGSAYPNTFRGTCGLCACGSIMNRAGYCFSEGQVIDFASSPNWIGSRLCTVGNVSGSNGRTTPNQWIQIVEGMSGIPMQNVTTTMELSDLAEYVESGHGVIIGVAASFYNDEWYGTPGGHALVLESVARDAQTNDVAGYYVVDSNGSSSADACRFVPAAQLDYAFSEMGGAACVTRDIIW